MNGIVLVGLMIAAATTILGVAAYLGPHHDRSTR